MKKATKPKNKYTRPKKYKKCAREKCNMIQWGDTTPHDSDGQPICPKCDAPAELILGFFGQPCYGHK